MYVCLKIQQTYGQKKLVCCICITGKKVLWGFKNCFCDTTKLDLETWFLVSKMIIVVPWSCQTCMRYFLENTVATKFSGCGFRQLWSYPFPLFHSQPYCIHLAWHQNYKFEFTWRPSISTHDEVPFVSNILFNTIKSCVGFFILHWSFFYWKSSFQNSVQIEHANRRS